MKKITSDKFLAITAYVLSGVFAILISFPLIYAISMSLQDYSAAFNFPPKLIPDAGKSISIVLDYTEYDELNEDELLDMIQRDAVVATYGTAFEYDKNSISEIKVYGSMENQMIYYSRAHYLKLRLEMDYGVYAQVIPSSKTLLYGDRYKKTSDIIGYEYDIDGIEINNQVTDLDSELSHDIEMNLYSDKYELNGRVTSISIDQSYGLLMENFKYYYELPKYVFKTDPTIAKYGFMAFFFNTVIVLIWAVITQVGLASLTAYPISKLLNKKTGDRVMMFFLLTLMIPFISILIQQLVLLKSWGMYDNYAAMLFPWLYPAGFYIYLFKGFFDKIPSALFDAARIDGASEWYVFTRVCMPLSTPIISVIALYTFLSAWNDFFWYWQVAKKASLWPINVAIYNITATNTKANFTMGLAAITIVPILLVTILFSKKIKENVVNAGIKG